MVKNYHFNFLADEEFDNLLSEVLDKLNKDSKIKIRKSDFLRTAAYRICMELKSDTINSVEFLLNKK